jgi:hypothetical protein
MMVEPGSAIIWAAGPQVEKPGGGLHRPVEGFIPVGYFHWPIILSPHDERDLTTGGVECHPDHERERFISDRARRDEVRGRLRLIRGDLDRPHPAG